MPLQQRALRRPTLLRNIWSVRRWLYAAYMVAAVLRIPARVRFHLVAPRCDTRLTLENVSLSMTKLPHMVLFAVFFILTLLQFDRFNLRAFSRSLVATASLGLLVELEEGASRTGTCRLTDVLPDVGGAAVASAILLAMFTVRRSLLRLQAPSE